VGRPSGMRFDPPATTAAARMQATTGSLWRRERALIDTDGNREIQSAECPPAGLRSY
jgi:hypothetical protein